MTPGRRPTLIYWFNLGCKVSNCSKTRNSRHRVFSQLSLTRPFIHYLAFMLFSILLTFFPREGRTQSDVTGPIIANVVVSGITSDQATITWQTDEPADSSVVYSDTSQNSEKFSPALVTNHALTLSPLAPDTNYVFDVASTDEFGNQSTSGPFNFSTSPANQPPTALDITVTTYRNTPVEVVLAGTDPDGDSLTYQLLSEPSNGTLSGFVPNLIYTPNNDYIGPDSFFFRVSDGLSESAPVEASITVSSNAGTTVYTDKAKFDVDAGPTRFIDFDQKDDGSPITDPPSQQRYEWLGLSGVCFGPDVGTYYNLYLTNFPGQSITADLPDGTYAFGVTLAPFYNEAGTHTITLSNGDSHTIAYDPATSTWPYFFGIVSDEPIDSVSFVYDTTYQLIDNFAITASAGPGDGCPPPPKYRMTDLGTVGGDFSFALGINDAGQVSGYSTNVTNESRAFLWDGATMQDLGTLGGTGSVAYGINEIGQVSGWSRPPNFGSRAFLWDGTSMRDLGTLGGVTSVGWGLNNAGQVTGYSQRATGGALVHAFLWDGTTMRDLGTLGGEQSQGWGINDAGQVTGWSNIETGTSQYHAFLWDGETMQNLGTLGGTNSWGYAISNSGQVCGFSLTASNQQHAFLWDGTMMRDLGTLGGQFSQAFGINDAGHCVGSSANASGTHHAFLWDGTKMHDLNDLIDPADPARSYVTFNQARDINNNGQISASGFDSRTGETHAYLLSPAPDDLPPVADAGGDQAIRAGETVFLDGSASFDDNTATADLQFAWSFSSVPQGSTTTLQFANTATPSFVVDVAGTYTVQLVVTDALGQASDPDSVTVSSDNLSPTANAGADQLVIVGTAVTLDGSGSTDPEDDALSFAWTLDSAPTGSAATLTGVATAVASITPDVEGQYVATLTVSDQLGSGAPDSVTVTAASSQDYAEVQIVEAATTIAELGPTQITSSGNQESMTNLLTQATTIEQQGNNVSQSIAKLDQAIARTDGCVLRGEPDGNGQHLRDWVTDCQSQTVLYAQLKAALDALTQP
jgi:probable HAF family extracellular repeat protein